MADKTGYTVCYNAVEPKDIITYTNEYGDCWTKLIIPDGVEKITARINSFDIAQNVIEVIIPKSVKIIGLSVFENCKNLTYIKLHDGITMIGEDCFAGCPNLNEIHWPRAVNIIGAGMFRNASISRLHLPKTLTCISKNAFKDAKISNLFLESVQDYATGITFFDDATPFSEHTCLHTENGLVKKCLEIKCKWGAEQKISNWAFAGLKGVSELLVTEAKTIGSFSFCDADFKKITFDSSVKYIQQYAFGNCNDIEELCFLNDEIDIDYSAFPVLDHGVSVTVDMNYYGDSYKDAYFFPELNNYIIGSIIRPYDELPF